MLRVMGDATTFLFALNHEFWWNKRISEQEKHTSKLKTGVRCDFLVFLKEWWYAVW